MTRSDNLQKKGRAGIDAVIFDIIIFCFFLLLALISFKYNPRARSIPMALGFIGSFMTLMQLLADVFPQVRSRLHFIGSGGLLAEEASPEGKTATARSGDWWRIFRMTLWLVGFIVLLAFTSYLIAVPAFIILVTKLEAGESWKRSILLALCVSLGFYILFDLLLQAQL